MGEEVNKITVSTLSAAQVMLVMELLSGGDLRNFLLNKAET